MTRTREPIAPPRTRPRPRPPATSRARGAGVASPAARRPATTSRPARAKTATKPVRRAPARKTAKDANSKRLAVCSALVIVVFAVLAGRVAQLQLMSGDRFEQMSVAQTVHTVPVSAERGSVFDRNGHDLALSVRKSTVYADPTLVTDPLAEAAKLAPVLKMDQDYLLRQLSAKPSRFAYLAHTVDDATADSVRALALPGIGFMPESARSYPAGSLAASVLGHVSGDGRGLDGIEYLANTMLTGKNGELVVEQDPHGHDIPNTQRTRTAARRGTDVVLSLDESVQWEAEHALLDQVQATGAKGGMSAIVDVTTGDVLAMATVHGATDTTPAGVAPAGDHNAPLTDLFEPGSTTKLITLSWALEHGHVGPDTRFTVPYSYRVPDAEKPFYDAEFHPTETWTTADILRESSNVGTIQIAQRMKNQELNDGVRAFGLGTKTAIDWPGQPNGLLLDPSHYYATGKYTTAIGYGAAVTGMQMLDAFVTIANGGETRAPRLIDATVDAKGTRHDTPELPGTRVVSPNTAAVMTSMMQGVIANGTGACAAIPGYPVAGKTGTSKMLGADGQYSDSATTASFIGFAPADHPRFAAMVVLNQPLGQFQFGGAAAAPAWSEMMQFVLTQYRVAPTDTTNSQYTQAQATAKTAGNTCTVPHGDALAQVVAKRVADAEKQANQQNGATSNGNSSATTGSGSSGSATGGSGNGATTNRKRTTGTGSTTPTTKATNRSTGNLGANSSPSH